VISLEFTNEAFEVSVQNDSEIRSTIPTFECTTAGLSACAVGEEVLAESGTTGKVMKLLPPGWVILIMKMMFPTNQQKNRFPCHAALGH
jgi:hypothetical protein